MPAVELLLLAPCGKDGGSRLGFCNPTRLAGLLFVKRSCARRGIPARLQGEWVSQERCARNLIGQAAIRRRRSALSRRWSR